MSDLNKELLKTIKSTDVEGKLKKQKGVKVDEKITKNIILVEPFSR